MFPIAVHVSVVVTSSGETPSPAHPWPLHRMRSRPEAGGHVIKMEEHLDTNQVNAVDASEIEAEVVREQIQVRCPRQQSRQRVFVSICTIYNIMRCRSGAADKYIRSWRCLQVQEIAAQEFACRDQRCQGASARSSGLCRAK